jgi:hypothetical protein
VHAHYIPQFEIAIKHVSIKTLLCPLRESPNNGNCGQLFHNFWGSTAPFVTGDVLPHLRNLSCPQFLLLELSFTVDAMEVLIKYCMNSFPQVDQFIYEFKFLFTSCAFPIGQSVLK